MAKTYDWREKHPHKFVGLVQYDVDSVPQKSLILVIR